MDISRGLWTKYVELWPQLLLYSKHHIVYVFDLTYQDTPEIRTPQSQDTFNFRRVSGLDVYSKHRYNLLPG